MLRRFKGTEFTFNSVFQDGEAIELLKTIDSVLQIAEWEKTKPRPGFPAINVYGKEDGNAVPIGFDTGIEIVVNSPNSKTIPSLPIDRLPPHIRAAIALKLGLQDSLSPKTNEQDVPKIRVEEGNSKTIRIPVGKNP